MSTKTTSTLRLESAKINGQAGMRSSLKTWLETGEILTTPGSLMYA